MTGVDTSQADIEPTNLSVSSQPLSVDLHCFSWPFEEASAGVPCRQYQTRLYETTEQMM